MNTHGANIAAEGFELLATLAEIAEKNGFAVSRKPEKLLIDAPLGRVHFEKSRHGTRMTVSAGTPAELQLLTDLYAERIANIAPAVSVEWDKKQAQAPLNQTMATVLGVLPLSPNFARIRLAGDFSAFAEPNVGLHFRFLLHPSQNEWPFLDAGGLTQWPGGIKSWHRPPYTVRRISENAEWIDVDIVLHSGGRVTNWCDEVGPGDEVALHGPSGSKRPKAKWLGLFGDETALPVILRILEDAPADTSGKAVIAIRDSKDAQTVSNGTGIEVTWVDMADTDALLNELRTLQLPPDERHVFFAAERAQSVAAREVMRDLGLAQFECKAASYWTS